MIICFISINITYISYVIYTIPFFHSGRLRRPLDSALGAHIQVVRSNQLEHGIILNRPIPLPNKVIPIDQLRQEDLHLLQGKVKPNAHALPHCKRDIRRLMSPLHLRRIPAVRVESSRVIPVLRVIMDMVKRRNDNRVFRDFVTARKNQVGLGRSAGLEGWVVLALCFFDEFVLEDEFVCDFGRELGVFCDSIIDQFLEESLLHSRVCDETVDEP